MRFFIIAKFTVHDIKTYQTYSNAVGPILTHYGGQIRIGSFEANAVAGQLPSGSVVIEFDSSEAAQRFFNSPEYSKAKNLFIASTQPDIVFATEVSM